MRWSFRATSWSSKASSPFQSKYGRPTAQVIACTGTRLSCGRRDLLGDGLPGLSLRDVRGYLEFVADQRLSQLGFPPRYFAKNPLTFLELQDVQELTNFFERRVASYQVGVQGEVVLDGGF